MADQVKNQVEEKKVYSKEEIQRISPNYRGKPENFNPNKQPKKVQNKAPPKMKSTALPPPTNKSDKQTPQRNEPIISEAIFGVDVSVTAIEPRQSFSASYAKLVDVTTEVFDSYRVDEKQLDRKLAREELSYYTTGLLHLKLIELKSKQGDQALSSPEKDIRKAPVDEVFAVPQPIFAYLQEIGTYIDKMGKETYHQVPALPVTVVQNFGGYHAAEVNADTHNLFEEIPSLGIAGDMVMALASPDVEPVPEFHIGKPEGSEWTNNLIGRFSPIGPRRPEIIQRLNGYGITVNRFAEYVPGTRFNLRYMMAISDIISQFETFRIEKVTFKNLGTTGGETQAIKTRPNDDLERENWRERTVQPTSASTSSTAQMGASYCFGFQLFKENGPGDNNTARSENWSCISAAAVNPWVMPQDWYDNRNARRNLPDGIGTERFRAIGIRQDYQLLNVTRRMIKTTR